MTIKDIIEDTDRAYIEFRNTQIETEEYVRICDTFNALLNLLEGV